MFGLIAVALSGTPAVGAAADPQEPDPSELWREFPIEPRSSPTPAGSPSPAPAPTPTPASRSPWVTDGLEPDDLRTAAVVALLVFFAVAGLLILLLAGGSERLLSNVRLLAGPALLTQLAAVAVALQALGSSSPVRTLVVLAFVCFGPGWAILRFWDLARGWAGMGLAIAVSLSLAAIVPSALLYAGAWSPSAALGILAGVTVAASTATIVHSLFRPRDRHY